MTAPAQVHRLTRADFDPRRNARLRLTLAFALLVSVVGAAIVLSVVFAMTFLTDYEIASVNPSLATQTPKGEATSVDVNGTRSPSSAEAITLFRVSTRSEILGLLVTTSLIVFGCVLVGGVILSWIIAGRVLRPIQAITRAARDASTGHLDHRIALNGPPDEFKQLADTFDHMLERLEASFQAQRRFAANASHELKSPLATTQAMLDVAILEPESVDVETLTSRLRETNTRNIETVEALLALAEAQAGSRERVEIDLDAMVREVVATATTAADDASVDVVYRPGMLTVDGDPTLLRLLVGNLVSNAIRHNLRGGDVTVTVTGRTLTVGNTGAKLQPEVIARLCEPFSRAAGRVQGSHGLGLALVAAIAASHGAELTLRARPLGGLDVDVEFPVRA